MVNYLAIERICRESSDILAPFVDDFLLYYAGAREKLPQEYHHRLLEYAHIVEVMPENWRNMLLSQFIAHRLFKRGGLARAYRGHEALRARSAAEHAFLEKQIQRPWRWSFCHLSSRPAQSFFEMSDSLTGERFLLYSPSMALQVDEQSRPLMSLLLLTDNGHCKQTYGPLIHFMGLFPTDILLMARLIEMRVRMLKDVPAVIERDPLPFAMLARGAELPVVVHKKDMMILNRSDLTRVELDPIGMVEHFRVDWEGGVARLQLKYWAKHPHFATAYFDTKRHELIATAMTERGWEKLVAALRASGVDLQYEAQIRGSINAVLLIGSILGRDLAGHPYQQLFAPKPSSAEAESLTQINSFLEMWMNAWNNNEEFDFEESARMAGLDPVTAREILAMLEKRFANDKRPPRRR